MKVNKRDAASSETHPEGWHPFQVLACEATESEFKGKKTDRFKWDCMSRIKREDGSEFVLGVWTGRDMVDDERCKLKQLVEACGQDSDEFEDTDDLIGSWFAGKCAAGNDAATKGFVNIVAFDTIDRCRPVTKAGSKKKGTQGRNPFEDE